MCLLTENKSSLHSGRVRKCPKTCLRNIWMVPKRAEQCFLFLLKVLWCTCVTKQLASSLKIIALYTMLDVCRIESSHSFNTQNMTNPTIMSPVKMEYGWNFSISGLKMWNVKSGQEKVFLKFLYALTMSFLFLNMYFWQKLLLSIKGKFI